MNLCNLFQFQSIIRSITLSKQSMLIIDLICVFDPDLNATLRHKESMVKGGNVVE